MKTPFLFAILLLTTLFVNAQPAKNSSKAVFANGASSTGWIDFELYNGNQIYVPVKINGKDVAAMLVNSIGASRIDKDFATSIGLQPKGDGASASVPVDIQLGSLTIKDVTANITQARPSAHARNFILGDDLFNNVIVDIDFASHRIAFHDAAGFASPAGAAGLPFIQGADSRSVPVSIGGAAPVQFELFLGDPVPLTVYQAYYQQHSLLANRPNSVRLGGGGGTHPHEATATLDKARFAGVDFFNVAGVFTSDSVRGSNSTDVSGNIGLQMLSRFRIIFDCPHDRLYALPYPGASNPPFAKDRSGLFLQDKGSYFAVEFVAPGSPAAKAGFKAGDSITMINQKPVRAVEGQAWQTAALGTLKPTAVGAVFAFTLQDGSTKQLTTADYF